MFERFTQDARQAVVLAQEEAVALRHGWIGTEHLLLGVLGLPELDVTRRLATLGVTTATIEPWAVDALQQLLSKRGNA